MGRMTRTVNGSVASFKSPGAVPIRSLKAYFTPIQNGSGDPSPSNIRPISGWNELDVYKTNKNILNSSLWSNTSNYYMLYYETGETLWWSSSYSTSDYIPIVGGNAYALHAGFWTQNNVGYVFYDSNKTYISGVQMHDNTNPYYYFVAPSNAKYMRFPNEKTIVPNDEVWLMDTTNIPVVFPASGKNLLDPTERNDQFGNNIFYYRENHTSLKAGTYTISTSASGVSIYVYQYVDGQQTTLFVNYRVSSMTFTLENDTDDIGFNFYIGTGIDHTATCQLERGSTATAYEPYTTTVYGGYVDLITGELVQEQIGRTFKGSDADQVTELTNTKKFRFRFYKALKGNGVTKAGITYCDKLQYQYHEDDKLHYYFTDNNSNGNAYAYLPKEFSDNDEVTIIASLYTPEIVATLSPTELRTLIGQNNVWCNADSVEVTYDLAEPNDIIRRKFSMMMQKPIQKVGIFTAGYEARVKPNASNSFVINHNLGIVPRFCLIEMDEVTRKSTNAYVEKAMIDFNVVGMDNDKTGASIFRYYYNNTWATCQIQLPSTSASTYIEASTTTINIAGYPYGTSRSQWDTSAYYIVHVWG